MTDPVIQILPAEFRLLAEESSTYLTADSPAALEALRPSAGAPLVSAGLLLIPEGFDDGVSPGIRAAELPALLPRLRAVEGVTVRGCFAAPDLRDADGARIAAAFHAVFQTAKRLGAVFPCAIPYVGFLGFLAPIRRCAASDPDSLTSIRTAAATVAMQDRTAFYAKLLIS